MAQCPLFTQGMTKPKWVELQKIFQLQTNSDALVVGEFLRSLLEPPSFGVPCLAWVFPHSMGIFGLLGPQKSFLSFRCDVQRGNVPLPFGCKMRHGEHNNALCCFFGVPILRHANLQLKVTRGRAFGLANVLLHSAVKWRMGGQQERTFCSWFVFSGVPIFPVCWWFFKHRRFGP